MTERKIKVFIVDDSAVARQYITQVLEKEGEIFEIVGSAVNGPMALEKLKLEKYESDVVIVDMVMPEMDGIEVIKNIVKKFPTPIVAISAFRNKEEVNNSLAKLGMELFESGVVDFVKKPDSTLSNDNNRFERQLIKALQSQAHVNLDRSFTKIVSKTVVEPEIVTRDEARILSRLVDNNSRIIIIGASTGGPKAISFLLSQLPPTSPPIIIVQHMPKEMMHSWCKRLQDSYPGLNINIAQDNEKIVANRIYLAPGGLHLAIDQRKAINLYEGSKVNFVSPAIDITFAKAAEVYGTNVLGIVLTGMGSDGCEGAREIKNNGGVVFVEHESTSVIYSMPNSVVKADLADKIIPLDKIPAVLRLNKWV